MIRAKQCDSINLMQMLPARFLLQSNGSEKKNEKKNRKIINGEWK